MVTCTKPQPSTVQNTPRNPHHQESCALPEWERAIGDALGPRYARLGSVSLRAISLGLWARRSLRRHVRRLRASSVATGLGNVVGNKGGVALSLAVGRLRLLFVGSHLAAHDGCVARRNADFHTIRRGLFAGGALAAAPAASGTAAPSPTMPRGGGGAAAAAAGGSSMFRVGSGLILPPSTPAVRGGTTPTGLWAAGGSSSGGGALPTLTGSEAAPTAAGDLKGQRAAAPAADESSQQKSTPTHCFGGFLKFLGSDDNAAAGGSQGGDREPFWGWQRQRWRTNRVAPAPEGFDDEDGGALGVPPRAASCPPVAMRPTLAASSAADNAGRGSWGLPAGRAAGEPGGANPQSRPPPAGCLPRPATSGALARLATRSEAGGGSPPSPVGSSRRPSFLFPARGGSPLPPGPDATELHDAVFWMGVSGLFVDEARAGSILFLHSRMLVGCDSQPTRQSTPSQP